MDIILHVGMPKTGSSALQKILFDNRLWLRKQGVLYPENVTSDDNPKHQWLSNDIFKGNFNTLKNVLDSASEFERVILSTESISNEIYNYPTEFISGFVSLVSDYGKVKLCFVDRELEHWVKSYYKQAIANQSSHRMPFYSTSDLFSNFIEDSTISRFMCREKLINDLSFYFNAVVEVFNYQDCDMMEIAEWRAGIKLPSAIRPESRNVSISDPAAEVMRQINGLISNRREKYAWTRVLLEVCPNSSAVMHSLADRADTALFNSLDISVLDSIEVIDNPPLRFTKQEIVDICSAMHAYLLSVRNYSQSQCSSHKSKC
ncbi:hypothetical protein [Vibrio crassostreae]|uniref:hypothetical protein n=1 Tax=Vibrio crassostreae TaxID=246167 RepID=UPI001B309005|nr:hypothetical protein [Vibrio crassostreae]